MPEIVTIVRGELSVETFDKVFEYDSSVKVERPHVWFNSGDRSTEGKAGLLLEWRQDALGVWYGRVILLNGTYHNPAETVTILWVKAEYLRPVLP